MFCAKLLFLVWASTVLLQTQCQENEGVEDGDLIDNGYDNYNGYYGYNVDYEYSATPDPYNGYYEYNVDYEYSATPDPYNDVYQDEWIPDFKAFPDISCHPGYKKWDFYIEHEVCTEINRLEKANQDEGRSWYEYWLCQDSCMFFKFFEIGVDDNNTNYFPDESEKLIQFFGEELGGKLLEKVDDECASTLGRIFDGGKEPKCNSPEIQELCDCVDTALKC